MVALAGAVFAQMNGFADVNVGTGTILVGLAAVIVGEAMLRGRTVVGGILACCLGSIVYRLAVAAALNSDWLGLNASDLNLVTAILVAVALILPEQRLRLIGAFAGVRHS
jgi:putative ABC transport system permease protein